MPRHYYRILSNIDIYQYAVNVEPYSVAIEAFFSRTKLLDIAKYTANLMHCNGATRCPIKVIRFSQFF